MVWWLIPKGLSMAPMSRTIAQSSKKTWCTRISPIMNQKTIVTGVIGADAHAVGNKIIAYALNNAGYKVVNLGVMVSQEEYIEAALETKADAILVSSLYGHGEIDCQGLREKCDEAGLKGIPLVAGGNLVVGKQDFADVESRFMAMGFTKVYPPGTPIETTIAYLDSILADK